MIIEYKVCEDIHTIKSILKNKLKLSNRIMTKLKNKGAILINNNTAFVNNMANIGDIIRINLELISNDNPTIISQKYDLKILYEDDYIIAVDKPPYIVTHPSSYHPQDTLSNYIKYHILNSNYCYKDYISQDGINYINSKPNICSIHPINRLDKGTSGVTIFAKNEYIQELFKGIKINKKYIAVCDGIFKEKEGRIDLPIARKEGSIIERIVDFDAGQNAITNYKVLEEIKETFSIVELKLETGRTHQIRVHLAYLNNPIIGDGLYNANQSTLIKRQALHAKSVDFIHPILNKTIYIEAPIEKDIEKLISNLKNNIN